ncbi:MAG: MerR family transcriptional regulator [Desulfotalea sp.]
MNIKKFSELTGMSSHTIRYYEKIGVFRQINRNDSGHRSFTEKDLVWAEFIKRLKDTGMSIKKILEYANLREQGPHTSNNRMQILESHANILEEKILSEQSNLEKLKEKIEYYKDLHKSS